MNAACPPRTSARVTEVGPERFKEVALSGVSVSRFPLETRCVHSLVGAPYESQRDKFIIVTGAGHPAVFAVLRGDGHLLCSGMGTDSSAYRSLAAYLLTESDTAAGLRPIRKASGSGDTAKTFAAEWSVATGAASRVIGDYVIRLRDPRAPSSGSSTIIDRFAVMSWAGETSSRSQRQCIIAAGDVLAVTDPPRTGDRLFVALPVTDDRQWSAACRLSFPYGGVSVAVGITASPTINEQLPVCRHPSLRGREAHYPSLASSDRVDVDISAEEAGIRALLDAVVSTAAKAPTTPLISLWTESGSAVDRAAAANGFIALNHGSAVIFSPPGTLPLR